MNGSPPRRAAALVATVLVLVACGGSGDNTSNASSPPPTTALPGDAPAETGPAATEVAVQQPADEAGGVSTTPAVAATEDSPTDTPTNTPVPVAAVGGRFFAEALQEFSDIETNVLPDLLVDDVRREAKSNLRNIFPADRPVLLWMWAPH